jgi:hypothetical protein
MFGFFQALFALAANAVVSIMTTPPSKRPKKEGVNLFRKLSMSKPIFGKLLRAISKVNAMFDMEFKSNETAGITRIAIVGGAVRDTINGKKTPKDLDLVCFGAIDKAISALSHVLQDDGCTVSPVVLKNNIYLFDVDGERIEFAPFRNQEVYGEDGVLLSCTHKTDPIIDEFEFQKQVIDDAKRRDLTINTGYLIPLGTDGNDSWIEMLGYNTDTQELFYVKGGAWGTDSVYHHIKNGKLYRVCPRALLNDPARIWRIIKYCILGYHFIGKFTEEELKGVLTRLKLKRSHEVIHWLINKDPVGAIKLMCELGLITPKPNADKNVITSFFSLYELLPSTVMTQKKVRYVLMHALVAAVFVVATIAILSAAASFATVAAAVAVVSTTGALLFTRTGYNGEQLWECPEVVKAIVADKKQDALKNIPLSALVPNPPLTLGVKFLFLLFGVARDPAAFYMYLLKHTNHSEIKLSVSLLKIVCRIYAIVCRKPCPVGPINFIHLVALMDEIAANLSSSTFKQYCAWMSLVGKY